MKFKYVGEGRNVPMYGGHIVNQGDVIELDDHFSEKAKNNPLCGLVEVKEGARVTVDSAEEIAADEAAKKAAADAKAEKKGAR